MSLRNEITERRRQERTRDDWYFQVETYALEIQSPGLLTSPTPGSAIFVLPLPPQSVTVQRILKQSVTPTLGGVIAEEGGLLWNQIEISGTFGLAPKQLISTAGVDDEPVLPSGTPISGPGATRKLIKGIIERYGNLKADPRFASDTRLIWHDFKMRESFAIVPEVFGTNRTSGRNHQFPFSFSFKTVGEAPGLGPVAAAVPPSSVDRARNAIRAVADAQRKVAAAIQEASAFLGEVRFFAAQIDSVIDNTTLIVNSASDFVNGITATLSIGSTFINSVSASLQAQLDLMEAATALPVDVRQNYQSALDGLDAIAATPGIFGRTYGDEAADIAPQEAGAGRIAESRRQAERARGPSTSASDFASRAVRSTDDQLVEAETVGQDGRTFGSYTGSFAYEVAATDSLQSIAARFLGNGDRWFDLAILNGLKAPYISESGIPGTVKVGDRISIPTAAGTGAPNIATRGDEPSLDLLGTDFQFTETSLSVPGRPQVDFVVDRRTTRDFKFTPNGITNLQQALQLRLWTEIGSIPTAPGYGRPRVIGFGNVNSERRLLELRMRQTVEADPRVDRVQNLKSQAVGDTIEISIDVIPIGATTAATVAVSSA